MTDHFPIRYRILSTLVAAVVVIVATLPVLQLGARVIL